MGLFSFFKPKNENPSHNLVPAPDAKKVMIEKFNEVLQPIGFDLIDEENLKWVKDENDLFLKVFRIVALKGTGYAPEWGFCFKYSPQFYNAKLTWRKTPKSANYWHLSYDPREYEKKVGVWYMSRFLSAEDHAKRVEEIAAKTEPVVRNYFEDVQTLEDLKQIFIKKINRKHKVFGFDNQTQHSLAFTFTLKHLGETQEADKWFSKFVENQKKYHNDKIGFEKELAKLENLYKN